MRNLKRALSLGLASSMVLGTMAFGVSGYEVSFNDADKINLEKQVAVVNQIGLMLGDDDGNFNPDSPVTRAEMAVICTTMLNGAGFHASQFVGTTVFNDVPEWCQDYVNLAASLGIVAGRGDGVFAPNDTVTTAEAMLMILKTLGYYDKDDSRLNEELIANWSLSATRQGTALNLYDTAVDGDLAADQPLNRENVASICFRALTDVVQVDYNPSTSAYYNYGGSMQNGVDNTASEYSLGYKYFLKLHAADVYDDFGRPATSWMYDGQEIDKYTNEATYIYTEQKSVKEMYNAIGSTVLGADDYERAIKINGETVVVGFELDAYGDDDKRVTSTETSITKDGFNSFFSNADTSAFLETGAGVLTEVFITTPVYVTDGWGNRTLAKAGEIVVSMVHTYLAEVDYVEEVDGVFKYYFDIPQKDAIDTEQQGVLRKDKAYTFETTEEFFKEEMVAVQIAYDESYKDYNVVSMAYPEKVSGLATSSNIAPDVVGGSWLAVDGETHYYSYTVCGNVDDKIAMAPISNDEIEVYLDQYGYVLGYESIVPGAKYLYVEDKGAFNLDQGSVRVTLEDGTEKTIFVSEIDNDALTSSNWSTIPGSGRTSAGSTLENVYDSTVTDITEEDIDEATLVNRIFGYVEKSDGTYRLTTAIRKTAGVDSDDDGVVDSYNKGVLGGINVGTTLRYTNDGLHQNLDDVSNYTQTPEKDTMFIYNSTNAKDGYDNTGKYRFKISNGLGRVYYTDATVPEGADPIEGAAFAVSEETVFIDVVGNKSWVGYSEVPSMTKNDLNMQVVFGTSGFADYVFINSGATTDDGGYFIVQNNKATWVNEDGVDTYTYTVWDLTTGKEKEIVTKDEQLKDQDGNVLGINDLYRITEEDEDYVYTVDFYYELDEYADRYYNQPGNFTVGADPMGAAYGANAGTIIMDNNEYYENFDADGRKGSNFNDYTNAWFNELGEGTDAIYTADGYTINSSTKFITLLANEGVAADNVDKFTIREGSIDDIRSIGENGTTWVDVVSADYESGEYPKAKTVLIIKPYGDHISEAVDSSDLSKCPVNVWRINDSASGKTEADPLVLVGGIDIREWLEINKTTEKLDTRSVVYRIVEQYATAAFDGGDGFGLTYDPSSLSLVIEDYGTAWDVHGSGATEWIVSVTGQIKDDKGNMIDSTHYVSFTFGETFTESLGSFDTGVKDRTEVHVYTGYRTDLEELVATLEKEGFWVNDLNLSDSELKAELLALLKAAVGDDIDITDFLLKEDGDGNKYVTATLTDKDGNVEKVEIAVGDVDDKEEEKEEEDHGEYDELYTGFTSEKVKLNTPIGDGSSEYPTTLTPKEPTISLSVEESEAYSNNLPLFAMALVSSYVNEKMDSEVTSIVVVSQGKGTNGFDYGDGSDPTNDAPCIFTISAVIDGERVYFKVDLDDKGFTMPISTTEANDVAKDDDLMETLASIPFDELEANVEATEEGDLDALITLSMKYFVDENTDPTTQLRELKTILFKYVNVLVEANTYDIDDVQLDDPKALSTLYITCTIEGFNYRVEITDTSVTEVDLNGDEVQEATSEEVNEYKDSAGVDEGSTNLDDSNTIASYNVSGANVVAAGASGGAGFDETVATEFPDALLISVTGDATPQTGSTFDEGVDDVMAALAKDAFNDNADIRLVSVSEAESEVSDLAKASSATKVYYSLAVYVNIAEGTKFEVVIKIDMTVNAAVSTITFDPNGGNVGTIASKTTGVDGKFTVPVTGSEEEPTRTGYKVTGWSETAAGTVDVSGNAYTENKTLYAIWAPDFTETKTLLGGTIGLDNLTIAELTSVVNANYKSSLDTVSYYESDYETLAADTTVYNGTVYALISRTGYTNTDKATIKVTNSGS